MWGSTECEGGGEGVGLGQKKESKVTNFTTFYSRYSNPKKKNFWRENQKKKFFEIFFPPKKIPTSLKILLYTDRKGKSTKIIKHITEKTAKIERG